MSLLNTKQTVAEAGEDFCYALSNSLGFGGHNVSLLIKKYVE